MALDIIPATTVVTVTSVMLALSWATAILRLLVRRFIRSLGVDDLLIVVGLVMKNVHFLSDDARLTVPRFYSHSLYLAPSYPSPMASAGRTRK